MICALRKEPQYNPKLSLVAEQDSRAIGHLHFTPMIFNADKQETFALALAPMSVHPEKQCQFVVSDESFMARKLNDEALSHAAVTVQYPAPFSEV